MGKIADALALILACTTANDASVNYSRYVPGCRCRYLEIPHCPNGIFTCFALVLAGRRCLHRLWHGELLIMHHHWQYSYCLCVCSRSKVPMAPMGKWLTRLPRLLLVHLRTLRSTPVGTCRRDLQKFPSPRWENTLLTCPIRFSSFFMGAASSTSMQYVPSAPETSKVPIAPMGRWLTCPNRISSFVLD